MEIGEDVGDSNVFGGEEEEEEKSGGFFRFMGIKYNFAHEKMNKSTKRVIGFKWVLYLVICYKCISLTLYICNNTNIRVYILIYLVYTTSNL